MFKCEKCNKITSPREKMTKVVTKTRDKTYTNIIGIDKDGNDKVKVTHGTEIVKEECLCENCASEENKD